MKDNLQLELEKMSNICFDIENKLPLRLLGKADTDAASIRRDLYRVRTEINNIRERVKKWGVVFNEKV